MRQYEIKDRQERRRAAEKKRLLEKAKMKNRKGKKGGKAATKNHQSKDQMHPPQHRYDQPLDSMPLPQQDQQSEEFFDDEYDDEPLPMPAPHPSGKANGAYGGGPQAQPAILTRESRPPATDIASGGQAPLRAQ